MNLFNTIAIMSNGFKIRVSKNSDHRNLRLFTKYMAEEFITLDSHTRK